MAADQVEREILIQASPEVVWGVITEPAQIGQWFSDTAELEPHAGAVGKLTWKPGGRGGEKEFDVVVPIWVVDAEPFRRFSFRWSQPAGAQPDASNSALVEFTLLEEEEGTRLRVIESGISVANHGAAGEVGYRTSHEAGWERHLGELLDYLAAKEEGAGR